MGLEYRVRYSVEIGKFDKPKDTTRIAPGVTASPDNFGYADDLFVASIINGDSDSESILLLSTEGTKDCKPSRAMLTKIRDLIDHYLEEH